MKKLLIAAIIAISAGSMLHLAVSRPIPNNYSAMEMANLEALTNNEGSGLVVECFCKISNDGVGICSAMGNSRYCGVDPCAAHDSNCR